MKTKYETVEFRANPIQRNAYSVICKNHWLMGHVQLVRGIWRFRDYSLAQLRDLCAFMEQLEKEKP